jgi:hypothetical protein
VIEVSLVVENLEASFFGELSLLEEKVFFGTLTKRGFYDFESY